MLAVTTWRFLIICGAGLIASWMPFVWMSRNDAKDSLFGTDLAMCLLFSEIGWIVGMGYGVSRHVSFTWTLVPASIQLFYGLRARVRWYLRRTREENA